MDFSKLRNAEKIFMDQYPGGFNHPEMVKIGKKHKMPQMISFVRENFSPEKFIAVDEICENAIKVVSRASMISVFEKPRFRDYMRSLNHEEREIFAHGLKERLHGDEQKGFEMMLDILKEGKLAKWPIMTIFSIYFKPDYDIFVKPTVTKAVIDYFDLKTLQYKPTPSWEFYTEYRDIINDMKTKVDDSFSVNNAAFTGFLMMSIM